MFSITKAIPVFTTLLCIAFFAACEKSYFFTQTTSIPNHAWSYDLQPEYTVKIADTQVPYDLLLHLTHSVDYPYQNIYLKFHATDPKDSTATTLVPINFANKGGVWFGDCDREWCTLTVPLQQNLQFGKAGNYRFKLEQYMRTENLEGIKDIGIRLARVQK